MWRRAFEKTNLLMDKSDFDRSENRASLKQARCRPLLTFLHSIAYTLGVVSARWGEKGERLGDKYQAPGSIQQQNSGSPAVGELLGAIYIRQMMCSGRDTSKERRF